MCIGLNMLCIKGDDKPYYDTLNNGHEGLIRQRKLLDTLLVNRLFVKIEVLPLGSLTSLKIADWEFKIDEENTLPSWFEDTKDEWRTKCIDETISIIKDIIKTKKFKGYLDLRGTQVKGLGSLQSVGGYLDLRGTQVKGLGSLQSVGGYLYLQETQVNREKIPQQLLPKCIFN